GRQRAERGWWPEPWLAEASILTSHLSSPPRPPRDEHSTDPYHSGYEMPYSGATAGPTYGPPQPWAHPDMHVMQQHHLLPIQARLGNIAEVDVGMAPPVMKSFKEFLLSLDDSVDETEAVKRYNDYKLDFRRQQMQDFFLAHKDEEWFRSKYHPDEAGRRKQEAHGALQNRLRVFLYLMDNGWFENLQLDIDKATAIVKMLDAAVIKMEGGTENDLKILDQEEEEERQDKAEAGKKDEARLSDAERKGSDKEDKKEEGKQVRGSRRCRASVSPPGLLAQASKKRKRKRSGDDSYDEGSVSESESESESGRAEGKEEVGASQRRARGPWVTGRPAPEVAASQRRARGPRVTGRPAPEVAASQRRARGPQRWPRLSSVRFPPRPQLRECELSPGVNRDLTRRVRNINGITQHKQIVRNDIKLAAKLIHTLDDRTQLPWGEVGVTPLLPSQNPILKNITDYLIEEVSAEEEELLGKTGEAADEPPKEGNPAEINVERDEKLIKVLDSCCLYLTDRALVDFTTPPEISPRDWRAPLPPTRVSRGDWEPDSWVLSRLWEGSRGLDPNVLHLCSSFLPLLPGLTPGLPYPHQTPQGLMPYGQPRPPIMGYGGTLGCGPPYPHAPYTAGRGNYDTFRGQGGYLNKPRNRMVRGDPRAIVEYRDLDAPEDVDFF
uniref:Serrate, RNA effector molecule n=1 Tax=Chelonoidis abingdonii TaxID=106734 RepID=A0A8C0JFT2_CHEAB